MAEQIDPSEETTRLDIWLWATRFYRSRSLATDACKKNQISILGQHPKPGRNVRAGERFEIKKGPLTRTIEVKQVLSKRVGAPLVENFVIDHTPAEEYQKAAEIAKQARDSKPKRKSGAGRPTKKDRRDLNEVMEESADEASAFEAFSKAMKKNFVLLLTFGLFFAALHELPAQEKRSFEVKEGVPVLKLNETLIVHARTISPEKNSETGALTSMAATGDVLIKVKPDGAKDWILVACDKAIYDPTTGSIILTGNPAVKAGPQIIRAVDEKTYVSVNVKTGKYTIEGRSKVEINMKAFKKC